MRFLQAQGRIFFARRGVSAIGLPLGKCASDSRGLRPAEKPKATRRRKFWIVCVISDVRRSLETDCVDA